MRTHAIPHTRQLELGRRLARRTLPYLGDGQPLPANVPAWMESSRDAEAFQSQLTTLRKALHKLLDNPIRLAEKGGWREVTLFESIIYRISPKTQSIKAFRIGSGGHLLRDAYRRDVFPGLSAHYDLLPLLDRLGIWERTPQADLFLDGKTQFMRKSALAAAVWPALKRDWRFRYLRHSLLPQRLALDKDVLSLALRCRIGPKKSVTAESFTSVWQQKALLESVARENSGLLPLILHGLESGVFDPKYDLVQALRTKLLKRGVTPAAWRYLTRYGARLFRPFWERKPDTDLFHLAAEYLNRLDEMGLPPPPSLAMSRTWLDIEAGYCNGELHWNRAWWNLPVPILGAAFHSPKRAAPTFLREFTAAAHWAIYEKPSPDRNQRKAGWVWVKRQWETWQTGQDARAAAGEAIWTSLIGEVFAGDLVAIPLTTEIQLVEEGLAMRNCLATYTEWCLNGDVRLFSIRRVNSGKRIADLSVVPEENGTWVVSDIKGYANTASSTQLKSFAWWIADAYTEAARDELQ